MNSDQVNQIKNIIKTNKNINKVHIYLAKNILQHNGDIILSADQLYNISSDIIKSRFKFAQKKNVSKVYQNGIVRELETVHSFNKNNHHYINKQNIIQKIYKDVLIDSLCFPLNHHLQINVLFLQYQKISSQLGSSRDIDHKEEFINESFKINSKTYVNLISPIPDSKFPVSPFLYCNYNHHQNNLDQIIIDGIQSFLQLLSDNNLLNK